MNIAYMMEKRFNYKKKTHRHVNNICVNAKAKRKREERNPRKYFIFIRLIKLNPQTSIKSN